MPNLLVIDDDIDLLETLSAFLAKKGHTVIQACGGSEGCKMLDENSIDVILTDIVMADGDGIETIVKIRKSGNSVPIIAMSGGGRMKSDVYLGVAIHIGADITLNKPFEFQELVSAIEILCEPGNIRSIGS